MGSGTGRLCGEVEEAEEAGLEGLWAERNQWLARQLSRRCGGGRAAGRGSGSEDSSGGGASSDGWGEEEEDESSDGRSPQYARVRLEDVLLSF